MRSQVLRPAELLHADRPGARVRSGRARGMAGAKGPIGPPRSAPTGDGARSSSMAFGGAWESCHCSSPLSGPSIAAARVRWPCTRRPLHRGYAPHVKLIIGFAIGCRRSGSHCGGVFACCSAVGAVQDLRGGVELDPCMRPCASDRPVRSCIDRLLVLEEREHAPTPSTAMVNWGVARVRQRLRDLAAGRVAVGLSTRNKGS